MRNVHQRGKKKGKKIPGPVGFEALTHLKPLNDL